MTQTVLIIDDEADIRTFLTVALRKAGYATLAAKNGDEGLQMVIEHKPDLIVLDLMMPRKSGPDLYRNLVDQKELGEIPVIIVSGLSGKKDLYPIEPAAVFDKPIDPKAFISAVKEALLR